MQVDITGSHSVESETDLWRAPEWAGRQVTGSKIRIIQTCVGPYGAIDHTGGGTTWFDVGDALVTVFGRIVSVPLVAFSQLGGGNNE